MFTEQSAGGGKVLQVVYKIVYDDEDTEQMSRLEIMDALNTQGLYQYLDVTQRVGAQRNMHILAEDIDAKPNDDRGHGVFGR